MDSENQENFPYQIHSVMWCPSMKLYGVIARNEPTFEVRRCDESSQPVFTVDSEVSKFSFIDDKALRTVIGKSDGSISIHNTDDGVLLYKINNTTAPVTAFEVLEHKTVNRRERKRLDDEKKKGKMRNTKFEYNSAQKYLLPIEFNETTKNFKRKLKYLESYESPTFLF